MDSISAFVIGEVNKRKEPMVFDWNKAARRIREVNPESASAGLAGDWEWTSGLIYSRQRGAIVNDDTYLSSIWATPELEMDGEFEDCYLVESDYPDWDSEWPESALLILEEKAAPECNQ